MQNVRALYFNIYNNAFEMTVCGESLIIELTIVVIIDFILRLFLIYYCSYFSGNLFFTVLITFVFL